MRQNTPTPIPINSTKNQNQSKLQLQSSTCTRRFDGTWITLSLYDSSDRTRRLPALTWWKRHNNRSVAWCHHRISQGRSGDFRWTLNIFVRRLWSPSDQKLDQGCMVWATHTSNPSEGKNRLTESVERQRRLSGGTISRQRLPQKPSRAAQSMSVVPKGHHSLRYNIRRQLLSASTCHSMIQPTPTLLQYTMDPTGISQRESMAHLA